MSTDIVSALSVGGLPVQESSRGREKRSRKVVFEFSIAIGPIAMVNAYTNILVYEISKRRLDSDDVDNTSGLRRSPRETSPGIDVIKGQTH